jgi:hypothetical protein
MSQRNLAIFYNMLEITVAAKHNHVQRRFLVPSKWSRVDGGAQFVHYECVAMNAEHAVLRSVLQPVDEISLPWQELRDAAVWQPGWVKCADYSART